MNIARHLRPALALLAISLGLVAAPVASAHKLSIDTARAKAEKKAQQIKRETNAKTSRVTKCRRKSRHKVLCKVRSEYRTGLKVCVTKVPVRYSSHNDRTARAVIRETICH